MANDLKPKIEEIATGGFIKDFVAWLRENKFNPAWASTNTWKVSFKTFKVCWIRFDPNAHTWQIRPTISDYDADLFSEEEKEIIWANKKPCCGGCNVRLYSILGKEYKSENACEGSIGFINPDEKAVECIKKLIMMRKGVINDGKAKRHIYVAMKNR